MEEVFMETHAFYLTDRLHSLKERYLKTVPSITIHRAVAFTEIAGKYPNLPANLRIAKSFRRACETAPMLIQPGELIVGHPCGKPRAGAFSPDISWDWLESELDTIATRAQDPYYISEADKRVIRNELFPFWKGKSSSEACDAELKKAGLWDYGVGAAITDLTYHMTSGGDTSPGFDIILLKKGVLAILAEAE